MSEFGENVKSTAGTWGIIMIMLAIFAWPALQPAEFLVISVLVHSFFYIKAALYPNFTTLNSSLDVGSLFLATAGVGFIVGLYKRTIILSTLAMLVWWLPLFALPYFENKMYFHN